MTRADRRPFVRATWLWAPLLCAVALPLAAWISHPISGLGICDEATYLYTAEVLARTGRFVFTGWASPIGGWHLYLGALLVHLLGPVYSAGRAATMLEAMALAAVTERVAERCGVRTSIAILTTLTVVLCPLMLTLEFVFMTDVGGVLAVMICLWMCLRALTASTPTRQAGWIVGASLGNALLGTVRQTGWLGMLVIVPCTLWLLRTHRKTLVAGLVAEAVGVVAMISVMHWAARQPYSINESAFYAHLSAATLKNAGMQFVTLLLDLPLFLVPLLLLSVPGLCRARGRTLWPLTALAVALLLLFGWPRTPFHAYEPFIGDWVTLWGAAHMFHPIGLSPPVFTLQQAKWAAYVVLPLAIVAAAVAIGSPAGAIVRTPERSSEPASELSPSPAISRSALLWLLLPYCLAYIALLVPRALATVVFDRYLLPLLIPVAIVAARSAQRYAGRTAIVVASLAVMLISLLSTALVHDAFAENRAWLVAIDQLRATGVPRTRIFGTTPYNAMTQLQLSGHLNDRHIAQPKDAYQPHAVAAADEIDTYSALTPDVRFAYALSYSADICGGAVGPAVTFHPWLRHEPMSIYMVRRGGEPTDPWQRQGCVPSI